MYSFGRRLRQRTLHSTVFVQLNTTKKVNGNKAYRAHVSGNDGDSVLAVERPHGRGKELLGYADYGGHGRIFVHQSWTNVINNISLVLSEKRIFSGLTDSLRTKTLLKPEKKSI